MVVKKSPNRDAYIKEGPRPPEASGVPLLSLLQKEKRGVLSDDFLHDLEEVRFCQPLLFEELLFISEVESQLIEKLYPVI